MIIVIRRITQKREIVLALGEQQTGCSCYPFRAIRRNEALSAAGSRRQSRGIGDWCRILTVKPKPVLPSRNMRQFAAVLILIAVFVVLVGARFHASDGDKLAAVARRVSIKINNSLPRALNLASPVDALRKEIPTRPEDAVKARLAGDQRLTGLEITVVGEATTIKLRGIVPDARTRKLIASLAENTVGVEHVVDELAIPE